MYIYKMLFLNRVREYKRLVTNMLAPLVALLLVIGFSGYQLLQYLIPLIKNIHEGNNKSLFYMMFIFIIYGAYICIIQIKPVIILKPMTLYLFGEKKRTQLIRKKYLGIMLKHILMVLFLASCIAGFKLNHTFYLSAIMLGSFLEIITILRWEKYHTDKRIFTILLILSMWILLISYYIPWIIFINISLLFGLFVHSFYKLKLDWVKYEEEMFFCEKLLTAQNYNNAVLLSQYAQEKKLKKISGSRKNSRLLSSFPIMWKACTSIYRLSFNMIIGGMGIFLLAFAIYKMPFFWSLPFLDQPSIRHMILVIGMLAVFQITIQSMLKQLSSIVEKAENGLFIPLKMKKILLQFLILPMMTILMLNVLFAVVLGSGWLQFIFSVLSMLFITAIVFFLELTRKKLLYKIYFLISICIFIASYVLSYT